MLLSCDDRECNGTESNESFVLEMTHDNDDRERPWFLLSSLSLFAVAVAGAVTYDTTHPIPPEDSSDKIQSMVEDNEDRLWDDTTRHDHHSGGRRTQNGGASFLTLSFSYFDKHRTQYSDFDWYIR